MPVIYKTHKACDRQQDVQRGPHRAEDAVEWIPCGFDERSVPAVEIGGGRDGPEAARADLAGFCVRPVISLSN